VHSDKGLRIAREAFVIEQGILSLAMFGATWVLWLLVLLSLGVFALSLERAIFILRNGSDRSRLSSAVNAYLTSGDAHEFREALAKQEGFEARILKAGMALADAGPDAVEKAMNGTAAAEKLQMERGLSFLATVGSNSPFIGLFGTVLGILRAFHDLSLDSADASKAVMAGISEALVATAVGLMVAIPAVILYNLFGRAVKNQLGRAASLADLVLARVSVPLGER